LALQLGRISKDLTDKYPPTETRMKTSTIEEDDLTMTTTMAHVIHLFVEFMVEIEGKQ
jgi:hypothetical protein